MKSLLLALLLVSLVAAKKVKPPVKPAGLIPDFYKVTRSCPQAEQLVRQLTWDKVRKDSTLGAKILRVHYHDCFVRVCHINFVLYIYICVYVHKFLDESNACISMLYVCSKIYILVEIN